MVNALPKPATCRTFFTALNLTVIPGLRLPLPALEPGYSGPEMILILLVTSGGMRISVGGSGGGGGGGGEGGLGLGMGGLPLGGLHSSAEETMVVAVVGVVAAAAAAVVVVVVVVVVVAGSSSVEAAVADEETGEGVDGAAAEDVGLIGECATDGEDVEGDRPLAC